jgi:hypothetical protein
MKLGVQSRSLLIFMLIDSVLSREVAQQRLPVQTVRAADLVSSPRSFFTPQRKQDRESLLKFGTP